MKYTRALLSLLIVSSTFIQGTYQGAQKSTGSDEVEFVIVIPSYKNEKWAADNLASACNQKSSRPFQVICINDCSPDRTGEIMENYVRENRLESMVTIVHNEKRLGVMANWYNTIHKYIPDHKVVVNLDGDDLLAHNDVLLTLEQYYRDPDVWLTYGSAVAYPSKDTLWYMSKEMPEKSLSEEEVKETSIYHTTLKNLQSRSF